LEQQPFEAALKRDLSLAIMYVAVSSLLIMESASSTVETHAGNDVERVLENSARM
jgi:hypothetical protein